MQLGMLGLGRMGSNLVRRLIAAGHECVVYDSDPRRKWVFATRDAVRDVDDADLGYPDPSAAGASASSSPPTSAACAGAVVTPETVLVVAGVTQGLVLLARLLARQGHDALAVEDPGSPWLHRVVARAGLRLVPVPVDRDGLDVSVLAATAARAVLCGPAHQFPTGAVLSPVRRGALVRWAMERDGLVIEDDYDAEFRWDRMPMGCVQGLDPQRVVLAGSVSRALAPGLRLGWIVPPDALLGPLVTEKRDADGGSPAIEQEALASLIEMGAFDRHLRRARKTYRARRDALLAAVARHLPGWSVAGAVAGLHVWLRPDVEIDAAAVVDAAAARGAAIDAVAVTGEPRDRLAGLVLCYARLDVDRAGEAVARVADAVLTARAIRASP